MFEFFTYLTYNMFRIDIQNAAVSAACKELMFWK